MMSLVVASIRLVNLAQSKRLNDIIRGDLNVQAMPHLPVASYSCQLTFQAFLTAVDNALDAAPPTARIDPRVASKFAQKLHYDHLIKCGEDQVERATPSVHAEVALATWLCREKLEAYPYIGVSKLSCGACHQYLRAINADMHLPGFLTGGTDGKYYHSWVCPPETSVDVRNRLVKYLQEVLVKNLVHFANWQQFAKRQSDSSVGSGEDIGSDAVERRYADWVLEDLQSFAG
ncbi:hypothetical protein VKT23_013712 [Stygiomarasmius scandens]|uniref:Uncharacterized protein n=1 Tax=Marasmiellus scandens TaxID=2682957 RepID=A0ABR1J4Y4_9AGAR